MGKTSVTIQVESETYEILLETQQKLKIETGKKTSLAEILNEYARLGIKKTENMQNESILAQNIEQNAQNLSNSTQKKGGIVQDNNENRKNKLLSGINLSKPSGKEEKRFNKKLKYLDEREDSIRDIESELMQDRDRLYNQKLDFLDNIDQFQILKTQLAEKEKFIDFLQAQLAEKTDFTKIRELFSDNHDVFHTRFDKLENLHQNSIDIAKRYFEENQHQMKIYFEEIKILISSNQENKLMKFIPLATAIVIPFMLKNSSAKNKKELLTCKSKLRSYQTSHLSNSNSPPNPSQLHCLIQF